MIKMKKVMTVHRTVNSESNNILERISLDSSRNLLISSSGSCLLIYIDWTVP